MYDILIRLQKKVLDTKERLSFSKTAIRFGICKTTIVTWKDDISIKVKKAIESSSVKLL